VDVLTQHCADVHLGALQKIVASLLKELDTFARGAIKAELESLDPLLKNLVLSDQMQGEGGDEY
jgi:hypothetical protein